MQMTYSSIPLILGYNLDIWQDYAKKEPITVDISSKKNSHTLISGMSGSGKSYCELQIIARSISICPDLELYFGDFKMEDDFQFLHNSPRYYSYNNVGKAIEIVYGKLHDRISGRTTKRHPIFLVIDEYVAYILSLLNSDNKQAKKIMLYISELLMLGRSKNIRILVSTQRPDATAFPSGSRLNFGIVLVLGAYLSSTYEMLMPEYMNLVKDRRFQTGEGSILLQGSQLQFIKIPMIYDWDKIQKICKKGLM